MLNRIPIKFPQSSYSYPMSKKKNNVTNKFFIILVHTKPDTYLHEDIHIATLIEPWYLIKVGMFSCWHFHTLHQGTIHYYGETTNINNQRTPLIFYLFPSKKYIPSLIEFFFVKGYIIHLKMYRSFQFTFNTSTSSSKDILFLRNYGEFTMSNKIPSSFLEASCSSSFFSPSLYSLHYTLSYYR